MKSWTTRIKTDKGWWPWRWLTEPQINERTCKACGQFYQHGRMPKEDYYESLGEVTCLVFPKGGPIDYSPSFVLGKWKERDPKMGVSMFIPVRALPDALILVQNALKKFPPQPQAKAGRK